MKNNDDLVTRLRGHDRHAVHDYDDDCEEAADEIERLRAYIKGKPTLDAGCRHVIGLEGWLDENRTTRLVMSDEGKSKGDLDEVFIYCPECGGYLND